MKRRDLMKLAGSALAAVGVPVALAGKAEEKEAGAAGPPVDDGPIRLVINTPDPAGFQRSLDQIALGPGQACHVVWMSDFYADRRDSVREPLPSRTPIGYTLRPGEVWRSDVAVMLCRGQFPRGGVLWAEQTPIFPPAPGRLPYINAFIYRGDQTTPDPTLIAWLGKAAPVFEGCSYAMLAGLDVSAWNNCVPRFSVTWPPVKR